MSVMIFLPAMPKRAGLFRKAIVAARERDDCATAVCVMSNRPGVLDATGIQANEADTLGGVMDKVAMGMADEEQSRAALAEQALEKLAQRCGLELTFRTESGDLANVVRDVMRRCTAQHVILIRPRSAGLSDAVDRAQEVLAAEFEGEVVVIA